MPVVFPPRRPSIKSRIREVVPAILLIAHACFLLAAEPASCFAGDSANPGATTSQSLPASVDLRPAFERWGLARGVQGDRLTCSAFVVAGALEFAAAKREARGTRLSVELLNWAANKTRGDSNDGGFFSDLWKGFAAFGICAETEFPYQPRFDPSLSPSSKTLAEAKSRLDLGLRIHWIKEWNVRTGLTDAHVAAIKRALQEGWPVCAGLRWPKQEEWVHDVLQWCPPNAVRDGHSVLLVGYRDEPAQPGGGVFLFRDTSHAGGDRFMPYAYARNYMNDAAWIACPQPQRPAREGGTSSGFGN
jgi:hypothetical protein